MSDQQEYYVHVVGPDEIHGPYTEIEAHREANGLNKISAEWNNDKSHEEMVVTWAVVQDKYWRDRVLEGEAP